MLIPTFSKYAEVHQNYTLKYICAVGSVPRHFLVCTFSFDIILYFWKLFNFVLATQREAEVERIRGNTMA